MSITYDQWLGILTVAAVTLLLVALLWLGEDER
jgi:hypothetical protein